MTRRRAQSAVPDHNQTPVIWSGGVQEDFRWVTGLHSSRNTTHAIGCQMLHGALQCSQSSLLTVNFSSSANWNLTCGWRSGIVRGYHQDMSIGLCRHCVGAVDG